MHQAAILIIHALASIADVVHLDLPDVLPFVIRAGANHDGRARSILPSTRWEQFIHVDRLHLFNVEEQEGRVVRMHFPRLVVCPRIVVLPSCLKRGSRSDKHVDVA